MLLAGEWDWDFGFGFVFCIFWALLPRESATFAGRFGSFRFDSFQRCCAKSLRGGGFLAARGWTSRPAKGWSVLLRVLAFGTWERFWQNKVPR